MQNLPFKSDNLEISLIGTGLSAEDENTQLSENALANFGQLHSADA